MAMDMDIEAFAKDIVALFNDKNWIKAEETQQASKESQPKMIQEDLDRFISVHGAKALGELTTTNLPAEAAMTLKVVQYELTQAIDEPHKHHESELNGMTSIAKQVG